MIEGVPDEFLDQVKEWKAEIDRVLQEKESYYRTAIKAAPQGSQKDFALWVQANFPKSDANYLFALKSGKDLRPIILKHAFENRRED